MTNTSDRNNGSVRSAIVGTWSLETWEIIESGGEVRYPLGEDPVGQLMYDDLTSTVSAQLVDVDQPCFASDDWEQASADEMVVAWPRYFGYFGTFTIDESAQTVTHHVSAGWFPNLAGTDQVRHYELDADGLILQAQTARGTVRIIWRRTPAVRAL